MFKIRSIFLLSKFIIVQCVSIKEIISREVVCPQDLEYTDDQVKVENIVYEALNDNIVVDTFRTYHGTYLC